MDQVLEIEELLINILSCIADGTTYKTVREVAKAWRNICDSRLHHMVAQFSNHLLTLLQKFPNKRWNIENLMENPNIPREMLLNNPNYVKRDKRFSNFNITLDDLEKHIRNITLDLCCYDESMNFNINLEFYKKYKSNLYKYFASQSLAISLNDITNNPQLEWDWAGISWRHDLTWDFIMANREKNWHWDHLSHNTGVTWEHITANPQYEWNWPGITQNPNITLDIILQNPQYDWDYHALAANPNITWDIIVDNPQIPWNYGAFSFNPNLTWEIVEQNPQINWNWKLISLNPFHKKNKSIKHIYKN